MSRYYLGLDVHKVRTQYCLVDQEGRIVREGNLPTEDVASLVELPGLPVVLEATGHWCAPYDALRASGGQVKLAHPARVRAIASARIKTDKIDARVLAHLLRTDLIPEAWAAPQDIRNLRDLLRLRWGFICDQTAAKNRIHVLLAREGLRFQGSDLFGRRGRRWLASLSLRPHVQELVSHLLQHLEETTRHVEALTERLHELLDADPAIHLLVTIPGVGFITAATLLAELGDWRRFRGPKQVAAYFGLVPSVRASASTARYGHLTKSGSSHARRVLVEAAQSAVRIPGPARHRYLSLFRRRGKKVAIVAAARTLLVLAWTLLINGEVYQRAA
jgi:transposase